MTVRRPKRRNVPAPPAQDALASSMYTYPIWKLFHLSQFTISAFPHRPCIYIRKRIVLPLFPSKIASIFSSSTKDLDRPNSCLLYMIHPQDPRRTGQQQHHFRLTQFRLPPIQRVDSVIRSHGYVQEANESCSCSPVWVT